MKQPISLACLLTLVAAVYAFGQNNEPKDPPTTQAPDQPPAAQTGSADGHDNASPIDLDKPLAAPDLTKKRIKVYYIQEEPADLAAIEAQRKLLDKKVKLTAEQASLGQALTAVQEQTGLPVIVSWAALKIVGIDPRSLHGLGPIELPAKHLLEHLLANASADAFDDDKAGYILKPATLYISTLRDIKSNTVTRIYDIRPLLRYHFLPLGMMLDDFRAMDLEALEGFINRNRDLPYSNERRVETLQRQLDNAKRMLRLKADALAGELDLERDRLIEALEKAVQKAGEIQGGGGLFFADDSDSDGDYWSVDEYIDQLRDLISTTVGDPDVWLDEESTLTEQGGRLIIQTSIDNHRMLEKLLNSLLKDYADRQILVLKQMQIMRILHQAYEASLDDKLNYAMQLVGQARRIDPNDATAFAVQVMLQDRIKQRTDTNDLVRRKLRRKVTVSQQMPMLETALKALEEQTKTTFDVRWDALDKAGVAQSRQVKFIYLNRQGNELLSTVLGEINKDLNDIDKLGYAIRGGKIVIDKKRNLNR